MPSLAIYILVGVFCAPTLVAVTVIGWLELRDHHYGRQRYELTELAEAAANDPLELWYQLGPNVAELGETFDAGVVDEHCI
jgi:hypothetical protein